MAFWKKILPKSEFFKNVLKLFSSTVVAGLIQAGALTIITRLYSKADIGNYQLLLSIILIFGLIASLKMVNQTWVWIQFDISTLISDHECSTKN